MTSPWMTVAEAAIYLKQSRRFVRERITGGKIRAAIVGGKRQVLTRAEWLDQFVEEQAAPVPVPIRRRA